LIALPLAFVGLVLALDVSGSSFSVAGAAWALLGSFGFAAVLILSALLLPKRADTRPRTLVMLATASIACIAATLASGALWFPTTAAGWGGLLGSALCYVAAMTSILFAAAALGATRVAIVMNVEPLASIVLTFLILGERLRPMQLVGALFVIVAIFLFRPRPVPRAAGLAAPSPASG
jgi:drug/metabolite transporter (DMT)-like permease